MADSFQGFVGRGGAGHADVRARIAVQGTNLHALTGDEVVRVPLARCSLERAGGKILVRDAQSSVVIWSEDEEFLDALERAQHGTLRDQVRRIRRKAIGGRLLRGGAYALMAIALLGVVSVPFARWSVRGGIPSLANRIGESSLQRLALPSGVAPLVERELDVLAERLRPASPSSTRSFRLLLAGYTQVHSFGVPPGTVVVTAGLVCNADGPDAVMAAVARELAHLESRDVSARIAEAVDWDTTLDLARGDLSKLRERMLDFANPRLSPGFTPEQEASATLRADAMLARAGLSPAAGLLLAKAQAEGLPANAPKVKQGGTPGSLGAVDWSKVRDEACELVGR